MMLWLVLWTFLAPLASAAASAPQPKVPPQVPKIEDQVVRLTVSKREVDPGAPWQYEDIHHETYLAVVVPGGRLLTTAYAVADGSFLELQRFGASRKDEAEVIFADYEVNLAVIRPKDPKVMDGLTPAVLGDDLAEGDAVDIYRARDAFQLARMPATLQEVGMFSAVTSSYTLASYLLKVQQTGLGWAEPVYRGGRLVALTTGQDANFVHALPMTMIKHFLSDDLGSRYRGFPAIGVSLTPLVSPEMRRLVGADKLAGGVRVAEVMPNSPFAHDLADGDVILAVGGTPVSEYGYFNHPLWGKMHLKYLLNQRYAHDLLRLKILRHGTVSEVERPLTRFNSNDTPVVVYRYGEPEPHLIFGGLIFQELSQSFLRQWGRDWREMAPLDLLYTMEYQNRPTGKPGYRYVFLTRVLADEVNRGYGEMRHQIVDRVNGVPVHSMEELRAALQKPVMVGGRAFAQIHFNRDGGEAILAYDALPAAHKRIAKTYEIHSPASFFTAP